MLNIGQKVIVKDNLYSELIKLRINKKSSELIHNEYVGTIQHIYHIWKDDEIEDQYWATIEMCVELPLQCLEEYNNVNK